MFNSGSNYVAPKEERFAPIKGARDLPWAILFVLHFLAVIGLCVYGMTSKTSTGSITFSAEVMTRIVIDLGLTAIVAIVLAIIWILLLKRFAHQIVWFTLIFTVVLFFSLAILALILFKDPLQSVGIANAVFFGICGLLQILLIFLWRKRIPFASALLSCVAEVTNIYPATVVVSFVSLFAQIGWISIWVYTVVGTQNALNNNGNNMSQIVTFILLVSFYWTTQVIGNTVHVTTAGTFATWYFLGGTNAMQDNPTLKSFKRATTSSFGSICLGSLLIAIIQAIRAMLQSSKRGSSFVGAIAACLLACIDQIVQFFNKYAFTQIAIYGKTFCQAGKDTWNLIKQRGVDTIINDQLVGKVMGIIAFISAIICGAFAAAYSYLDTVLYDQYGYAPIVFAIVGFVIGLVLVNQVLFVIDSGVATVFVCFAEDPHALSQTKPALYQVFRETYEEKVSLLFQ